MAVALKEADTPVFKKYAKQVMKNATVIARELAKLGWHIISGGTDSHLVLVDTWMNSLGISGKEASERLEKAGIIVNKNTIPNETRTPSDPSGIRLGTAAETTRGRSTKDFQKIAEKISAQRWPGSPARSHRRGKAERRVRRCVQARERFPARDTASSAAWLRCRDAPA